MLQAGNVDTARHKLSKIELAEFALDGNCLRIYANDLSSFTQGFHKRNGIFLFTSGFEVTVTMSPQHGSLSPWLTLRWLPV